MSGNITVANAPVSYGAFELTVGHDPDVPDGVTVLDQVAAAGYAGIDLGPVGYLGSGERLGELLAERGLGLAGAYVELPYADRDALERALPELDAILPRPIPAILGIPDWFKTMPAKAFSDVMQTEQMTVKKCPPFIDAMTFGFLIPLVTDLHIKDGTFTWHLDFPSGAITSYPRSPLDFHDNSQVVGTPLFDEDSFIVKFNNFWTIETPPG